VIKFQLPVQFKKVPRGSFSSPQLWPIGQLYHHGDSDTYFRFLRAGNRWEPAHGISTSKGTLSNRRVGNTIMQCLNTGPMENLLIEKDRNILCAKLLSVL